MDCISHDISTSRKWILKIKLYETHTHKKKKEIKKKSHQSLFYTNQRDETET